MCRWGSCDASLLAENRVLSCMVSPRSATKKALNHANAGQRREDQRIVLGPLAQTRCSKGDEKLQCAARFAIRQEVVVSGNEAWSRRRAAPLAGTKRNPGREGASWCDAAWT